jgi:ABC-type multidrug transport system ATPase subunit
MIIENLKKAQFINFPDNIKFEKDICIAIIGKNGHGKTTLLRLLSGNILPDSGEIHINNSKYCFPMKILTIPKYQREMRKDIIYIENQNYLYNNFMTRHNIDYIMSLGDFDKVIFYSILGKFDFSEKYFKSSIGELSLGTKQKISIALAFSSEKPIILLDEPSLGLDIHSKNILMQIIKDKKSLNALYFQQMIKQY